MKVTQLRLAGQGTWRELAVDAVNPQLAVFFGQPRSGKSTVAGLLSHLLFGKTSGEQKQPYGPITPLPEGSVEVVSPQGNYLLRRHRDGSPQGRLSIASVGGPAVDSRTIRSLLSDVSPRLLAELYSVDFAQPRSISMLLNGEFAREFTAALNPEAVSSSATSTCPDQQHPASTSIDRHRLDDLAQRRDAVVRDIEQRMSGSRRSSDALDRQLREVDAALNTRRQQVEPLQAKLRAAEAKLAEIAATLRFFSIESAVRRRPEIDDDRQREEIERLDAEISRCRQTLSDMQLRDATVRRELAEVHPDGTADSASSLADQRATVGVFERLLDDLDAEVAQLARSHEPGRCVGCDSHTRFSPVAQMLRQQLYTLCGQVTEQERAVRRMQLNAEARQLARAQTDLSEQLEHLLLRRQSLVHESQLAQRPVVMLPQLPAASHCHCEGHAAFVRDADAMLLARTDRSRREEAAHAKRAEFEQARDDHRAACDALQQEITKLQATWRRLQQQRAQTSERSSLDELRRELERLETEIERTLNASPAAPFGEASAAPHRRVWKASDVLAQLTDGQLSQIRLGQDGAAMVIDRQGDARKPAELTRAQQDQLYLALTLALVSSFASRGVDLPLVLDEPFLRQDARDAAAMASVLDEFARQGRQVIAFTSNLDACRRFESLGVKPLDMDHLRRESNAAPPVLKVAAPPAQEAAPTVRIVRETTNQRRPKLRVAAEAAQGSEDRQVYYLMPRASMGDFPVLGNDTAAVFAALGISTVEHLLAADAEVIARKLNRTGITAATIRLWQSHMSLMCFVPGVSLNEAQVPAASEVSSPEALMTTDTGLLMADVEKFLASDQGQRFSTLRSRFTRERLTQLQQSARGQRSRWVAASQSFNWVGRPTHAAPVEPPRIAGSKQAAPRKPKPAATAAPSPATRTKSKPLAFLLEVHSPIEQAPSIDAAAAESLANVGIRTVADLLNANPDSTADELADERVSAATVSRWQSEARLACRIPELRCFGAQLLVATGFTEAEQVAAANPTELFNKVKSLCRSPQGKRFLREGHAPSRDRVAQWIRHAAHMRPLKAA